MRQLVTRYEDDEGHGWYVGSDAEIVLAPGEPEVWPGMFEAYVRLRGEEFRGLEFRSAEEEAEFRRDVRTRVDGDVPLAPRGAGGDGLTTVRPSAPPRP